MLSIEQIRNGLKDRNLKAVARNVEGISYETVYTVATGKNSNPTYETIKALSAYLEGIDNKEVV